MKPSEAVEVVQMLMAAFPRQIVSTDTAKIYCEFLADLDIAQAKAAARHHIATSRWFPTIAELRDTVNARAADLPDAEVAWLEVTKAVRNVGRYRVPAFSSPVLTAAVEAIGWQNLCNGNTETLGVDRAHFFRTYASLRTRHQQGETLAALGLTPESKAGAMQTLAEMRRELAGPHEQVAAAQRALAGGK